MISKNNILRVNKFIHEVEKEIDVNAINWQGVKLWPVIRLFFYFQLNKKKSGNSSVRNKKINLIERIIRFCINLVNNIKSRATLLKVRNINTLYVGTPHFRINYNGKKFNRYFDHSLDKSKDLLVELDSDCKKDYQNRESVLLFNNVRIKKIRQNSYSYSLEKTFNNQILRLLKEHQFYSENIISELENYVNNCLSKTYKWEAILDKTKPDVVKYLGYSRNLFALNIAAHKRGISTVDVQHGIQGKKHPVYSEWLKIPSEGYEALPNEFHCWDEFSAKIINSWASKTSRHSAKCNGNPWINYYKQNVDSESALKTFKSKKIILFTMQPFEEPLEGFVLDAIKETKNKYNWWLRFHPAQTNKSQIIDLLKQNNIYHIVNVEDASNKPLLDIFQVADLHITKTSSCILEALYFDLPSIIIDKEGVEMYEDYFESPLVDYLEIKTMKELLKNVDDLIQ